MRLLRWVNQQAVQNLDDRIRELEEELAHLRRERERYIAKAKKR